MAITLLVQSAGETDDAISGSCPLSRSHGRHNPVGFVVENHQFGVYVVVGVTIRGAELQIRVLVSKFSKSPKNCMYPRIKVEAA